MIGWIMLAAVAAGSGLLLLLLGFPRRLWTVAATAIMLGAAGYAWQGNPGIAGSPVSGEARGGDLDPAIVELREALFGRFTLASQYFGMTDAMLRSGSPGLAARTLQGAVRRAPDDVALWTWLGVTLSASDGNQVSPASRFAFERAIKLAPNHPGPHFFLGLVQAAEGKLDEARQSWATALELTPADAYYRTPMLVQIVARDPALRARLEATRAEGR